MRPYNTDNLNMLEQILSKLKAKKKISSVDDSMLRDVRTIITKLVILDKKLDYFLFEFKKELMKREENKKEW